MAGPAFKRTGSLSPISTAPSGAKKKSSWDTRSRTHRRTTATSLPRYLDPRRLGEVRADRARPTRWSWHCTRSESRAPPRPRGHLRLLPKGLRSCPRLMPETSPAHVFLPGAVIAVGESFGRYGQGEFYGYESSRQHETISPRLAPLPSLTGGEPWFLYELNRHVWQEKLRGPALGSGRSLTWRAANEGLLTHAQLRSIGVGRRTIDRWLRVGAAPSGPSRRLRLRPTATRQALHRCKFDARRTGPSRRTSRCRPCPDALRSRRTISAHE